MRQKIPSESAVWTLMDIRSRVLGSSILEERTSPKEFRNHLRRLLDSCPQELLFDYVQDKAPRDNINQDLVVRLQREIAETLRPWMD